MNLGVKFALIILGAVLLLPRSYSRVDPNCHEIKLDHESLKALNHALKKSSEGRSFSDGYIWRRTTECGRYRYAIVMLLEPFETVGNYSQHYLVDCRRGSGRLNCKWSNYHAIQRPDVDGLIQIGAKEDAAIANRVVEFLAGLSPTLRFVAGAPSISESAHTINYISNSTRYISVRLLSEGTSQWELRLKRNGSGKEAEFKIVQVRRGGA